MTPNTPKGATTESVEPSAAFTPGPWVAALGEVPYEEFNGELTWTVDAPDNWGICTIDCPVSDREANARLIAAAPDQHVALLTIAEGLEAQVRATCGYLIQNGISPHFAEVLMSHYLDFAQVAREAAQKALSSSAHDTSSATDPLRDADT